jgi:DeoR family transcriptional regulator of aga operon/DeoR family fructose operon transcriptional repressor
MAQTTKDRRSQIISQLIDRKHVTVKDIAAATAVSEATIRRDLRSLASNNQVMLVYGGATLPRHMDSSFQARHQRNLDAKKTIGSLAAALVADGEQLFMDSGTTCFEMAAHLRAKTGLSVLVNSARLAIELQAPSLQVIMLGGQYRPERMDTVGPITTGTLSQIRGYVAFIGADGVSIEFGPSAVDLESADLYRQAISNAREAILLVDHTKFQSAALFKIVPWRQIGRVVTDRAPVPEWRDFFAQSNIQVIHPPAEPGA